MNSEYKQATEQAKVNLADLRKRGTDAIGSNWEDLRRELLTPEERAASKLRVALMMELTRARSENGLSQRGLEELSGVKQPVIARMERGYTSPRLDTVLKVLAPLGKTLSIVPLEKGEDMDKKEFKKTLESVLGQYSSVKGKGTTMSLGRVINYNY